MRRLLASSVITLGLAVSAPTLAKSSNAFGSTLAAPIDSALKIEVVLSEDLAYRAENLPKKLSDRSSARRLNSGFANNGFYGARDLARLVERLERKMTDRLQKEGVDVSENAPTILKLVLTDARPNRPTFRQLSKEPSLSFKSFGIGGAKFEGEVISADGESLGDLQYGYYETDIRYTNFGSTWNDANRAIDRFARKTAKTLTEN